VLLTDRDVVFFGGKGGTGKTTCSSAFALAASRRGRRVLLVSTDPAHSTSDIFEKRIGDTPREILPNLSAVEIDAERESARYIAQVKQDVERMFSPNVIRQAHRQIEMAAASPGLTEVALLDRMIDLMTEHEGQRLIVFDTAPTGHTLQLLRMPDAMTTWIQALLKHRRALLEIDRGGEDQNAAPPEEDPVVLALERRHRRLVTLRSRITDRSRTAFVLVTIAERLAVEETVRAASLLADTSVEIGALIVNRVLPDGLSGDFYASRKAQEREYLEEIDRRFSNLMRVPIAQLARDVYGLAALGQISEQLRALLP
jgi:arsenite-transporting ATPase